MLERELGRGGMAAVHLARDAELGREVAIKVLAGHLAGDPAARTRFVREARAAARLSHPNVVQVFDAGEDDGVPFIVMEYVPGSTLAEELRAHGRIAPARTVDLALQVCGGLAHAHEAGLVHRDVKPGNLLVRDDGTVKIADFGIARALEATQLTQAGSVLGTAAYLAPEQAAGEPVTEAADLYALGVVLYELLTGRTPFAFESLAELVARQRAEPVTPVRELEPDVPPALEETVMRCLARNPAYRPASAGELARDLAAGSPEPPTAPLPPPRPPAARRPPRRRAAAWAAAVALVLVAAAAGAWAALSGDPEPAPAREPARAQPADVEPVPSSEDPAVQARNLSAWLRDRAG